MPVKKDKKEFMVFENAEYKNLVLKKRMVKTEDENGNEVEVEQEFCTFEGYASTFGNKDFHDDIVEKGAFVKSISKRNPALLLQHNAFDVPIGKITSIQEDEKGLYIKAEMPMADNRVGGMIAPQMKIGSFKSMSIGYRTVVSEMNDKTGIRTLKELDLMEISLVTFPANDKARVTGVKAEFGIDDVENVKTKSEFEDLLKSTGAFSRKACIYLASKFQNQQSESVVDVESEKQEQSESVVAAMGQISSLIETIKQSTQQMR